MKKKAIYKLPWGIFGGISLMLWSFVTIAFIVVHVISYLMIKSSGGDDGLGQAPWLMYLYIGCGVFLAISIACFVLYFLKSSYLKKMRKQEVETSNEE